MQEEFHGTGSGDAWEGKQLYHWDTLNTNIWLPSLSELVGIDANKYNDTRGAYQCAMKGLGISGAYHVVLNGGSQFEFFAQFNANGGGQTLWDACNRQQSWMRSCSCWSSTHVWRIESDNNIATNPATASHAVHPAVSPEQVPYHSISPKGQGEANTLVKQHKHLAYKKEI